MRKNALIIAKGMQRKTNTYQFCKFQVPPNPVKSLSSIGGTKDKIIFDGHPAILTEYYFILPLHPLQLFAIKQEKKWSILLK